MVLMAIVASAVVVSFRGRQGTQSLRVAAEDLAGAIRYAQRETELRGAAHRLQFTQDLRSYRVELQRPDAPDDYRAVAGRAGGYRSLPEGVAVAGISREGALLAPPPTSLGFLPGPGGFAGVIELRIRNGQSVHIEVMPTAGQVHVLP